MENVTAVLLAAGESSRFFPFNTKHKCLVKICGEEIIVRCVKAVKNSGIDNIIVIVSDKEDFEKCLGDGSNFGVKITYVVQEEANGMGEALLLAKDYLNGEFFLINSNHIEFDELKNDIDSKRDGNSIVLLGKKCEGNHFGALQIEGDKVLRVVEKPESSEGFSNLRIVGAYFLNQEFLNVLSQTQKHHYSFESALDECAKKGLVKVAETDKTVLSLKYPWQLLSVKDYVLSRLDHRISETAKVSEHSIIEGKVVIEDGVVVQEYATLKGPCYIGKNAYVGSNSLLRNGVSIEEGGVAGSYMEVKNSIIMSNSKAHSGHLEDSVLGENSRIGANFTSSNVRLDRGNVSAIVKGEKVDTGLTNFGVIIGSHVKIGVNTTTMPGLIIGNNVNIGPSTTVMKNVDSDTTYYTEFKEIVEKRTDN